MDYIRDVTVYEDFAGEEFHQLLPVEERGWHTFDGRMSEIICHTWLAGTLYRS